MNPIARALDAFEPTHLGVQNNRWLAWHCLAGGIAGKLLGTICVSGADTWKAILTVLVLAVTWEIFQWIWQDQHGGLLAHNASLRQWFWDSFFDIVGATGFAALSV